MAKKIRDIAVKTGEYTDNNGQTKGRWQNVGALMKGDDGGEFIILERWFNPAGIPDPQGRGSTLLSCFPLRENGGTGAPANTGGQPQPQPQPQGGNGFDGMDDDIPFS